MFKRIDCFFGISLGLWFVFMEIIFFVVCVFSILFDWLIHILINVSFTIYDILCMKFSYRILFGCFIHIPIINTIPKK